MGLAFVERRLGQWPEALGHFAQVEASDPQNPIAESRALETLVLLRRFIETREQAGHAVARFPDSRRMRQVQIAAQYEIDGDRSAYLRLLDALPDSLLDPQGLRGAYESAMRKGDYEAADRALADPQLRVILSADSVIADPVALHRALVAFVRGQRELARQLADEAIAYYRAGKWTARQESWVLMGVAQANAFAGRTGEALRDAPEALAREEGHDVLNAVWLRSDLGRIYAALDRREEAIAVLRTMMTGPSGMTPQEVRHDPLWLRLKDEPRFEEILKAAKAL